MEVDEEEVVLEESEELRASLPSLLGAPQADELHAIIVDGGAPFTKLAAQWRNALGPDVLHLSDEPSLDTARGRSSLLMLLSSQAQAVSILRGRAGQPTAQQQPTVPPQAVSDGALLRQRGALKACCAALRVAPPADAESPIATLQRLRLIGRFAEAFGVCCRAAFG